MAKTKKKFSILPLLFEYDDKPDLIEKLLKLYSVTTKKLTNRNIDLLTMCILYDMNDKEFRKKVIDAGVGFTNEQQINTEFTRLKKLDVVKKHNVYNKKYLSEGIEKIDELINNGNKDVSMQIFYEKR